MCVVAIVLNAHPRWRLVLAGNRDELHARPSAPLARWEGADSHIIAGRDLVSGGTWLGVSEAGRVAVVTNIRTGQLPDPEKQSRGALTADFLRGKVLPPLARLDDYNAFSLLTVGAEGTTLTANRPAPMIEALSAGIHGLSNGAPGDDWARKDRLLAAFADCLETENGLPDALLALLASESIDDTIFIRNPVYGTRCSTVVTIGHDGSATIIERRYCPNGAVLRQSCIAFHFDGD